MASKVYSAKEELRLQKSHAKARLTRAEGRLAQAKAQEDLVVAQEADKKRAQTLDLVLERLSQAGGAEDRIEVLAEATQLVRITTEVDSLLDDYRQFINDFPEEKELIKTPFAALGKRFKDINSSQPGSIDTGAVVSMVQFRTYLTTIFEPKVVNETPLRAGREL